MLLKPLTVCARDRIIMSAPSNCYNKWSCSQLIYSHFYIEMYWLNCFKDASLNERF